MNLHFTLQAKPSQHLSGPTMNDRTATISRKTNETEIEVHINLDCQPGSASQQIISISTGIGFLDHVRFSKNPTYRDRRDPNDSHVTVCMHARTRRCTMPLPSTAECLSRSRPKVISGSTTITQLISPVSRTSHSTNESALLIS